MVCRRGPGREGKETTGKGSPLKEADDREDRDPVREVCGGADEAADRVRRRMTR
jgi:hypothetical protein